MYYIHTHTKHTINKKNTHTHYCILVSYCNQLFFCIEKANKRKSILLSHRSSEWAREQIVCAPGTENQKSKTASRANKQAKRNIVNKKKYPPKQPRARNKNKRIYKTRWVFCEIYFCEDIIRKNPSEKSIFYHFLSSPSHKSCLSIDVFFFCRLTARCKANISGRD